MSNTPTLKTENESIWFCNRPTNYRQVKQLVYSLWPVYTFGSEGGGGGRILNLHGAGPGFKTAPLQQLVEALAGHLRYQTFEIFLSRPREIGVITTPVLVAIALRRNTDVFGRVDKTTKRDGRVRHPYKFRGVSDLSNDNGLKKLRQILLAGESIGDVLNRMNGYVSRKEEQKDLNDYVDYSAVATAISMLAGPNPSDIEGPAPFLWNIIKNSLSIESPSGTRGLFTNKIRNALFCLTRTYGELLLEDRKELPSIIDQVIENTVIMERMPHNEKINHSDIIEASIIWQNISEGVTLVNTNLRKSIEQGRIPSLVARVLFEAPIRSYPNWLNSATLSAEKKKKYLLFGSMHQQVKAARKKRNKPLSVITLEAYEKATEKVLVKDHRDGQLKPTLQSMLLFPFELESQGLIVDGIVRFMNRFDGINHNRRLFEYSINEQGGWDPTEEEVELGLAVTNLLRDKLIDTGLFPTQNILNNKCIKEINKTPIQIVVSDKRSTSNASRKGDPILKTLKLNLSDDGWNTLEFWRNHGLIGFGQKMERVFRDIEAFARRAKKCVLILGETGTGKELVANAIYNISPRATNPFIARNCGCLDPALSGSELFGHEKGAFTGAIDKKKGAFQLADGGTLFLDEIGDIPLEVGLKLLRVLEDYKVRPIGSTKLSSVDVHVISATNQQLEDLVARKTFRNDLFYRLGGRSKEIYLPPLSERQDELPELIGWILWKFKLGGEQVVCPSRDFLEALLNHHWTGNVRELVNTLDSALDRADGSVMGIEHLPVNFEERF